MTLKCPICRKEVPTSSPDVPFCSDRCRLIDLGKWASGDYKIVSPIMDPDLLEEIEQAQLKAEMLGEPETVEELREPRLS